MTLDGAPMEVSITGEPVESVAPKSVFDRLQGAPVTQNIRHGLFGTAIDSNEEDGDGGPRFSVTLGGTQPAGRQTKLVQPFSGESSTTGSSRGLVQPFAKKAESHRSNNHTSGDGNSNRFLYRDDDNRNGRAGSNERRERGGDRRDQQQQSRGGNNRNNSGHGGAGARGLRGGEDKSNSMDASGLDADLDAYFASKA